MEFNQLQCKEQLSDEKASIESREASISLEAEIPEVLYEAMKDFIGENPSCNQYSVMTSAVANFLFQNGCQDRAVTEKYLDDLFNMA